jgi:uncharacterized protein (DUF1778 family)
MGHGILNPVKETTIQIDQAFIRLSQKDARKVFSLLDNPPKPNKRLKDAVKQFKATKINPKGI